MSKYNYAFSDYPFPDDAPDFPHHTLMSQYIHDYVKHFGVDKLIRFNLEAINIEKKGEAVAGRVVCVYGGGAAGWW